MTPTTPPSSSAQPRGAHGPPAGPGTRVESPGSLLVDAAQHAARALVHLDSFRDAGLPQLRSAYDEVHKLLNVLAGIGILQQLSHGSDPRSDDAASEVLAIRARAARGRVHAQETRRQSLQLRVTAEHLCRQAMLRDDDAVRDTPETA